MVDVTKPEGYRLVIDHPKPQAEDQNQYVVVLRRDRPGAKAVRIGKEPLTKRSKRARRRQAIRIGTAIVMADKEARIRVIKATIASLSVVPDIDRAE
jgi:hypothetical protein